MGSYETIVGSKIKSMSLKIKEIHKKEDEKIQIKNITGWIEREKKKN